MSSYREAVFRYGEQQSGFGIMTLPTQQQLAGQGVQQNNNANQLPVLVIFNAGLLHREEPYRLPTLLARTLAASGVATLRVDLAGKGDSQARDSQVSNSESVALDWAAIKHVLTQSFGSRQTFILMGLCSGADNAVKLACDDEQVVGMVLLDPLCPRDKLFYVRRFVQKLFHPSALIQLPTYLWRKFGHWFGNKTSVLENQPSLRDAPSDAQLQQSMALLAQRNGHVLAIFSSYAYDYYNQVGQLAKVLDLSDDGVNSKRPNEQLTDEQFCCEYFWPEVSHLYSLQSHRDRLVETIAQWLTKRFV